MSLRFTVASNVPGTYRNTWQLPARKLTWPNNNFFVILRKMTALYWACPIENPFYNA